MTLVRRRTPRRWRALRPMAFVSALACASCLESPVSTVSYEAVAAGGDSSTVAGSWTIRLTRAELAFGPVYFCAAQSGSSTLCDSAVAEITQVARIDALDDSRFEQPLGTVRGFTGRLQSASYDWGISWFPTSPSPTPARAAPLGHSVRLEGTAERGAVRISFTANVDVVPQYQGQTAVPTARVDADITSPDHRLVVTFHPARWMRQVDFDAVAASGRSHIDIEPGGVEHNAILVGMKNLAPPEFRWDPIP